jgi:hypothetical protein
MMILFQLRLHKKKRKEIDINSLQNESKDRKKIESILSRRTMSVKYEIERSEKKMQTVFSRINVYRYIDIYIYI